MKISTFLLFVTIFNVFGSITYSQNARLNLDMKDATIQTVLRAIEGQSEFFFLFSSKMIDVNKRVDINVVDRNITDVLGELLTGTDIKYAVREKQILLFNKEADMSMILQQNRLTGRVTDEKGNPLPGVTVLLKGTSQGALTDVSGKYILDNLPNKPILIFSFVGYTSQEIPSDGRNLIDVVLKETAIGLDEVVVVGYGTQKKSNLTGSISTVSYDQNMKNRPITNVSQSLGGLIPGVYVSQNSGSPGFDNATIRIRGYGTLNNTDPLILIDGVEGSLSELNPNEVASITVFKDASSAAIYGSRAANGVVLVETKKGEAGKVTFTYNSFVGIQQLGRHFKLISNSAEVMSLWNQSLQTIGSAPLFPDDVISAFKNGTDPYKYPNTNWFNEVFRNAITTQHNISASFGTEKSKTFMSIGYQDNDGIVKNTNSKRFSFALNHETQVSKWLKLGARSQISRKISTEPYQGISRVIYMMSNGRPFETPYLQDGKTFGGSQALYISGPQAGLPIVDTRNPFPDLYNGNTTYTDLFMKGNVYATINFMKGLSLTGQYSGQYNIQNTDRYNQMNWCYTDLLGSNKGTSLDYPSTLYMYRGISDQFYSTSFANLNFNHIFADKHEVTGLLGLQSEDLIRRVTTAQTSSPPKDNLHEISSGTAGTTNSGDKYLWRMISYFGRINYVFMGKYLAEVNLRADASSRFAKGNRWGYFPSLSVGWRLGQESFIKNLGVFDNLKLRASWGKLGNQSIGSSSNSDYFPYLTVINQSYATSYNFNNTLAPGAAVTGLVDPSITWETTTTSDIGLDMGFLKNRLSVEADYFQRITSNIIVQLPISSTMGGLSAPYQNEGKMNNTGFEINLNWRDQTPTSDLSYSIGVNLSYVTNKVTKFEAASPDQLYLIRQGYSYKALYGYIFEGIYQSDADAKKDMYANSYTPNAGDIKYKDVNGDGKLDYQDMQVIGNTIPKYNFGINGNVSWKNFDLSFLFSGLAGVYVNNQSTFTVPLGISGASIEEKWINAWTPENHSTTLFRLKMNDTWNTLPSSFWCVNMTYVKLKNLQLGYTIPTKFANKINFQKLYVYLNGTDLFSLVSGKYEGYDPERDTFSNGLTQYPNARIYTIGLNVTF